MDKSPKAMSRAQRRAMERRNKNERARRHRAEQMAQGVVRFNFRH